MSNVVFDLGGVLLTWDPPAIVSSVIADPAMQALVLERVFRDPEWLELDRGAVSRIDVIERCAQRTGMPVAAIERVFNAMLPALVPVPAVVELVVALRRAVNRLYVLSNFQREALTFVEATYGILALFDGRVVSCEVGACKPEPAIYRHPSTGSRSTLERASSSTMCRPISMRLRPSACGLSVSRTSAPAGRRSPTWASSEGTDRRSTRSVPWIAPSRA